MAEVLTDERIAAVLRPFVRATAPVLKALRECDPLGLRRRFRGEDIATPLETDEDLPARREGPSEDEVGVTRPGVLDMIMRRLDAMQLPGSSTWDAMTVDERCDWWAGRVGRFLALLTGLPRFGGLITSKLPIRNALGMAAQGLVLSAIAAEHGVTSSADRVRLIAKVVLDRDLSESAAAGGESRAAEDAKTAELTEEIDESRRAHGRPTLAAVARTVWRMARALWEIHWELDKRPQGRFYHEMIGNIPVVGVVGGYLGERSALHRVARQGSKWIRRNQSAAG